MNEKRGYFNDALFYLSGHFVVTTKKLSRMPLFFQSDSQPICVFESFRTIFAWTMKQNIPSDATSNDGHIQ